MYQFLVFSSADTFAGAMFHETAQLLNCHDLGDNLCIKSLPL